MKNRLLLTVDTRADNVFKLKDDEIGVDVNLDFVICRMLSSFRKDLEEALDKGENLDKKLSNYKFTMMLKWDYQGE